MEKKAAELMDMISNCLEINNDKIVAKEGYNEIEAELVDIYNFVSVFSK